MSWLFASSPTEEPDPKPSLNPNPVRTQVGTQVRAQAPPEVQAPPPQQVPVDAPSSKFSAYRERADQGAAFTSRKCPPGPGLENSCELPFGFVWTPMADLSKRRSEGDHGVPVISCRGAALPPVLCLTCLTYLNPHCTVKYTTGIWTCALCGAENVLPKRSLANASSLLAPVLLAPIVEYHQQLPIVEDDQDDDDDYDNERDDEDICTVILVVDANLDKKDALAIVKAVEQTLPELQGSRKIRLGLVVFDQAVTIYQLGMAGVASADVYTILDEESDLARLDAMEQRAYLVTVESADDLESLSQCLWAVFGVAVDSPKQQESRLHVLKKQKEARIRQEQLEKATQELPTESPWIRKRDRTQHRCTGEALQCAMDLAAMQQSRTSRILLFTNGAANLGEGSVIAEVESEDIDDAAPPKRQSKVVHMSQMAQAIEYYDGLATMAWEEGIALDVFCAGFMELGLPAYQALVEPSGGYVLPHSTFDSPHLVRNLGFCLNSTHISRVESGIPGSQTVEDKPKSGFARLFGRPTRTMESSSEGMNSCIVDIRTDSFLTATHLVGPGEVLNSSEDSRLLGNEMSAFAEGSRLAAAKDIAGENLPLVDALELSMTRVRVPRYDPLATISVMIQVNDTMIPEDDDHAFFQLTVRFISQDGKTLITRVCTHRFPVADSVSDYVKNVDDQVVSVLLAKGAVYRALHGREETEETKDKVVAGDLETIETLAYEAQLDLDATIQRISGAFRLLALEEKTRSIDLDFGREEKKESSPSSLDFAFPPQLADCLRRLYHLRRGALISPGPLRSMDDRAEVRHLFLRFPLADCLGMMAPNLWSTGNLENSENKDQMIPFPAETMALWDTSIIAADQHDVQFVWSGKSCANAEAFDPVREKFKTFLMDKAQNRFPMPEIHILFDGDSMSRRFTTRLAPSHADSPDQQLANFPELASLSSDVLESVRSRFQFYDADADASFRKWFWSVSSATHPSREDGMSLCE